jgi:inorganic pyrophosphatase
MIDPLIKKLFFFINLFSLSACSFVCPKSVHYIDDFPTFSKTSVVNMVVEIPAGTNQKWEVRKDNGRLEWEIRDGKGRVVQYLAYPFNYGMVPQTKLPKELGGDGDPLDMIVLGSREKRGSIVEAKPIGVLKLVDTGERDDKIIAVKSEGPLSDVSSLKELEFKYPGSKKIIETWFTNYKGKGLTVSNGFEEATKAVGIIEEAHRYYEATIRRAK